MMYLILLLLFIIITVYYFYPEKYLDSSKPIDKILVLKSKHKLQVFNNDEMLKEYTITIGRKPIGTKHFDG
jgi:hypothetical protein